MSGTDISVDIMATFAMTGIATNTMTAVTGTSLSMRAKYRAKHHKKQKYDNNFFHIE